MGLKKTKIKERIKDHPNDATRPPRYHSRVLELGATPRKLMDLVPADVVATTFGLCPRTLCYSVVALGLTEESAEEVIYTGACPKCGHDLRMVLDKEEK